MGARIEGIGAYTPSRRVSNDELAEFLDTSDEWIRSHTGIGYRHIARDDEATSDLGAQAAKIALDRSGTDPESIDMVLVATASSDYVGFPSTACIVQHMIGAKNAAAMDISVGCTGFVYGLETAKGFIASGAARHVLLIGSEVLTRIVDWTDRSTCVLFGDGAGAAVISPSSNGRGILDSVLKADGSGASYLAREVGGTRTPFKPGHTAERDLLIKMEGQPVYNFAIPAIIDVIRQILDRNGLTIDDITYIVPHQANQRIIEAAAKRSRIPYEKFYLNIEEYANTSAATIPIALNELYEHDKLSSGDLLITVGFGAGLTFGGNLLQW
jgi:3-oxoacyl-[acyl-carrier-protein] synthase-3